MWLVGALRSSVRHCVAPWRWGQHWARSRALARLQSASSFEEWTEAATEIDKLNGADRWRNVPESDEYDWRLVQAVTERMRRAREDADAHTLMYLLGAVLHRRFASIDASSLYTRSLLGTKVAVEDFLEECQQSIAFVVGTGGDEAVSRPPPPPPSPTSTEDGRSEGGSRSSEGHGQQRSDRTDSGSLFSIPVLRPQETIQPHEKLEFFEAARLSMGRTALCLSGGGSLAMYHLGLVRELLTHGMLPRVIAGTSGGSIIAALVAIQRDKDLLEDFIRPEILNRYQAAWFDPPAQQVRNFVWSVLTQSQTRVMETDRFTSTTKRYFESWTFAEAFKRTGRVVNLVVTVRYGAAQQSHPLLLNYLTTPNVLLWSAVAASCALPGLMRPVRLMAKTREGREVPFHPSGVRALDGSMHSDIPTEQLSRMFHVTRFLVSQVNPHVAPFLREEGPMPAATGISSGSVPDGTAPLLAPSAGIQGILSALQYWMNLDIQHRTKRLAKLRLIPRLFGQEFAHVFLQRYRGHVTVSPRMSVMDKFKVLSQPTEDDMRRYIREGQRATWPRLAQIRTLVALEKALGFAVRHLRSEVAKNPGARAAANESPSPSHSLPRHRRHQRTTTTSSVASGEQTFPTRGSFALSHGEPSNAGQFMAPRPLDIPGPQAASGTSSRGKGGFRFLLGAESSDPMNSPMATAMSPAGAPPSSTYSRGNEPRSRGLSGGGDALSATSADAQLGHGPPSSPADKQEDNGLASQGETTQVTATPAVVRPPLHESSPVLARMRQNQLGASDSGFATLTPPMRPMTASDYQDGSSGAWTLPPTARSTNANASPWRAASQPALPWANPREAEGSHLFHPPAPHPESLEGDVDAAVGMSMEDNNAAGESVYQRGWEDAIRWIQGQDGYPADGPSMQEDPLLPSPPADEGPSTTMWRTQDFARGNEKVEPSSSAVEDSATRSLVGLGSSASGGNDDASGIADGSPQPGQEPPLGIRKNWSWRDSLRPYVNEALEHRSRLFQDSDMSNVAGIDPNHESTDDDPDTPSAEGPGDFGATSYPLLPVVGRRQRGTHSESDLDRNLAVGQPGWRQYWSPADGTAAGAGEGDDSPPNEYAQETFVARGRALLGEQEDREDDDDDADDDDDDDTGEDTISPQESSGHVRPGSGDDVSIKGAPKAICFSSASTRLSERPSSAPQQLSAVREMDDEGEQSVSSEGGSKKTSSEEKQTV